MHVIHYNDGDEETLDLTKEKIEWLACCKPGRPRIRKLSSLIRPRDESPSPAHEPETVTPSSKRSCRRVAFNNDSGDSGEEGDDTDGEWAAQARSKSEDGSQSERERENKPPRKARKTSTHESSYIRATRVASTSEVTLEAHGVNPLQTKARVGKAAEKDSKGTLEREKTDMISESSRQSKANCPEVDGETNVHLTGATAERFGHRDADKFSFLGKGRKDASGKRPGDPEYDPRTLYLPTEFLKGLPAAQRQWWEFKSKHMDKVLLFKMGKFYEMFEMDAHIGAQKLDLQYMKGEQPHCGFPEKNFEDNAEKLARMGYRVLVVEQVETPGQMEQRNKLSGTKDKVVRREICAVISKGTITEGGMLASTPDAAYLMSTFEIPDPERLDGSSMIGLCFVDTATARFVLGQFVDDMARSQLKSILLELRPVELIKPRGTLTWATEKALKDQTREALVTNLTPGLEFWDSKRTIEEVALFWNRRKFENGDLKDVREMKDRLHVLPDMLQSLANAGGEGEAALCALGGCVSYLRQSLLDQRLLSFGRFELLPGSDLPMQFPPRNCVVPNKPIDENSLCRFSFSAGCSEPQMVLDSSALENLDILENSHDAGTSGTLLGQLDHCVTSFGRRLLKQWIVRPLLKVEAIVERQNAVEDMKGVASEAVAKFRRDLARLPDMERLVVQLHACSERSGRNAQAVVLYEDAAKKLLKDFMGALRGFQTISQVLLGFLKITNQFRSNRLRHLLTPGEGVPNLSPLIQYFEAAFNWSDAERTGRISPHEGIDPDFDSGSATVSAIEAKLKSYLEDQQAHFQNQSDVTYVTVGKERYQIEIPNSLQHKVPQEYEVRSQRKGFRRYSTSRVKELFQVLVAGEDKKEIALKNILQGLVKKFCENYACWLCAVRTVAELDALISLSMASKSTVGATCKPVISTNFMFAETSSPFVLAEALRHPILESCLHGGKSFVPNDVSLGGRGHPPFMLLTGPNMGGKSTLLRQVCLAVILAQIGADVPAEDFQLSPVDRIFVRMGARDNIMAGQSTFLVELLETASMLTSATSNSLVALDELGRGTATSDGQAIAHAVLEHLAHNIGCRGMFSTHYHRLANDHANDPKVALYHMSCRVEICDQGVDKVTFLYKLAHDACPKSYGVNVARIAGLPETVLRRADTRSAEIESIESMPALGRPVVSQLFEKLFLEVLRLVKNLSSLDCPEMIVMDHLHQQWKKVNLLVAH